MFGNKRFFTQACLITLLLLSLSGCGQNSRGSNHDALSNVRIVNAVSDVDTLDFYLDNKLYFGNVGYLENSGYSTEDTNSHTFQVSITGTGTRLVSTSVSFADSRDQTLLVCGTASKPSFVNISDNNTPASSDVGKVRFIDTSLNTSKVDVYITKVGDSISALAPALKNVTFRQVSQYILLNQDTYTIAITTTGTKSVIASIPSTAISGNGVYSVLIADNGGNAAGIKLVFLVDHE